MRKIKLTLSYDGTNYVGWQVQPNGVSIQALLQSAIQKITGEETCAVGAGRTDAGVHALGQVAHFITESHIPCHGLKKAINTILPYDIGVVEAVEVATDFHSMRDAAGKIYRYRILQSDVKLPLFINRCWHVSSALDLESMRRAMGFLVGEHDFESFRASGCTSPSAVRSITRIDIDRIEDSCLLLSGNSSLIDISVEGNSFVRYMVRNIVGTLVGVGQGCLKASNVESILEAKDRKKAGVCAPACGLYLVRVIY